MQIYKKPYNKPTNPGPLQIPPAALHHKAEGLREEHNEKMVVFLEASNIENLLKTQLQQAIAKICLANLID